MNAFRACCAFGLVLATATFSRAEKLHGLTDKGWYVTWNSDNPGTLLNSQGIGLADVMVGLDGNVTDPAAGPYYLAAASRSVSVYQYSFDIQSVKAVAGVELSASDSLKLGSSFGFEASPTPNKFRVVTNGRLNLEITANPVAAYQSTYTALPDLFYAVGDANAGKSPNIVNIAFGVDNLGQDILYGIDAALDSLVWFTSSNGGELRTVGKLGAGGPDQPNIGPVGGFEISPYTGRAYVAVDSFNGYGHSVLELNLATAGILNISEVGGGERLIGIAVPEPMTCVLIAIGALAGVGLYRRC